ncbi:TolC family protein [Urbifossiella limnaea]|uniref:TolC family protein n=1 Tax=Urbifossiella limnaea TaxID=2528023 RepID=UPI00192E4945|nr:TolC family protein [Urbifossiella limnaea]
MTHVLVRVVLAAGLPAVLGCASVPPAPPAYPSRAVPVSVSPPAPRPAGAAPRGEDTDTAVRPASAVEPVPAFPGLNDLLALAQARNPDLAAAAARVGEARGRMVQAGLYPNPTVGYSGNQINDGPGTPGQQGGYVAQEFVTAGKLRIATAAARAGVSAADWQAASTWFDTAARVRTAYVEYLTARAVLRETERTAELFAGGLDRAEKLTAGGKAEAYDVTRLRVETVQIANRVGGARQRVAAAERLLAVAVGVAQLPAIAEGELPPAVALPGYDEAVELTGRSSFVLAAAAEAEQARGELRAAEVRPVPNVHTMTTVAHDYTTRAPMASVQVGVPLPVFDRNRGNIAAAQARLVAAEAGVEQARLRATERLAGAYQRYENARRQLDLYRTRVLPDAAAALEQIDRVYAARGERFLDTLDARRVLTQARIDYTQTLGDLWAAAAEIEAVTQPGR